MSRALPTLLPGGRTMNALLRRLFEGADDATLAAFEFGPWPLIDMCLPPADWRFRPKEMLDTLNVAADLVKLDKPATVERVEAMGADFVEGIEDALARWSDTFRAQLALLEETQDRLLVAQAVLLQRAQTAEGPDAGGAA